MSEMHFYFSDVLLLHYVHLHVSASYVAIFRVISLRPRIHSYLKCLLITPQFSSPSRPTHRPILWIIIHHMYRLFSHARTHTHTQNNFKIQYFYNPYFILLFNSEFLTRNYVAFDTVGWFIHIIITIVFLFSVDRGSSVGIATSYGLVGPGIESPWARDFSHPSIPALGPTQPPIQCIPGLSRE